MPIKKVRTARDAASAASSTGTDTSPEASKKPSVEATETRPPEGCNGLQAVPEQRAALIDVRFSVHAVHQAHPGKLVTYMVEEPDEDAAKAKANELWDQGVKEVRLVMHSVHLIGRRQR